MNDASTSLLPLSPKPQLATWYRPHCVKYPNRSFDKFQQGATIRTSFTRLFVKWSIRSMEKTCLLSWSRLVWVINNVSHSGRARGRWTFNLRWETTFGPRVRDTALIFGIEYAKTKSSWPEQFEIWLPAISVGKTILKFAFLQWCSRSIARGNWRWLYLSRALFLNKQPEESFDNGLSAQSQVLSICESTLPFAPSVREGTVKFLPRRRLWESENAKDSF